MRSQHLFGLSIFLLCSSGVGCGGDDPGKPLDAQDVQATGIWDLTSDGSADQHEVQVSYADGTTGQSRVSAQLARAITLQLMPLPVSGRIKVGLTSAADPVANTVSVTMVDQLGRAMGEPALLKPQGRVFAGELILAGRSAAPASSSAALLLDLFAEPSCPSSQQTGLSIELSGDGSSAEMTQFTRLLLDAGSAGCRALLQAEAEAAGGATEATLSPLGQAIQSGALSADKLSALESLEVATAVTVQRISTDPPPAPLSAQTGFDPQQDDRALPIELLLPALVAAGSPVTIEGYLNASARPEDRAIALQIKDPGGAITQRDVTASAMGWFSTLYAETAELGTYAVTATQAGNAIETSATFEVVLIGNVSAAIQQELKGGLFISEEVMVHLETVVTNLPPSAEKDELLDRISSAQGELAQGKSQADEVALALDPILIVAEAQPALASHLAPELQALSSWAAEGQSLRVKWQSMLDRAKMQPTLCDTIEYGGEAFTAASTALNFTSRGVALLVNLAADKLLPQAIAKLPFSGPAADQEKLVVTEGAKSFVALAQGYSAWVTSFLGIAFDLAAYASQQLMKAYCVRFEGPLSVGYAEIWYEAGTEWAQMIQQLSGKIVVRYPKGAPTGGPIPVTGHIEGNATKFDFWEHYELVEDPAQYNLLELTSFYLIPLAAPFDIANNDPGFGMFARMAMPAYFNIPLQGEIQGDKLAIKLMPATLDYSFIVKYTLVVALFEPITLIPEVFTFDFPARKAETVLKGIMKEPFEVTLVANQSDKTTRFQQSLSAEEDAAADVKQLWSFTVQAKTTP